jgi:uncharacterized protein
VLYYLDTAVIIYSVEGAPADLARARNHLATLDAAGHRFVISELTRTECLIPVFAPGEEPRLSEFFHFFHYSNLRTAALSGAMHARAAMIRGGYYYPSVGPGSPKRYGLADALHLAAAIESGCEVLLTNDDQLAGFPDITVERLP